MMNLNTGKTFALCLIAATYLVLETNAAVTSGPTATAEQTTQPQTETQPDVTGTEADVTGTQPDVTGTQPDATGTPPDITGTQPSATGTQPGATGTEPDVTGTHPSATATRSGVTGTPSAVTGTESSNTGTEPDATGTPPDITGTQPSATGTQPGTAGTEPEATTGNATVEVNTGATPALEGNTRATPSGATEAEATTGELPGVTASPKNTTSGTEEPEPTPEKTTAQPEGAATSEPPPEPEASTAEPEPEPEATVKPTTRPAVIVNECMTNEKFCAAHNNTFCRFRDGVGSDCPCKPPAKREGEECVLSNSFGSSLTLDKKYDATLDNPSSPQFIAFAGQMENLLTDMYDKTPGFISAEVIGFRSGSVIVDSILNFEQKASVDVDTLKDGFANYVNKTCGGGNSTCNIGGVTVDVEASKEGIGANNAILCLAPGAVDYCHSPSAYCNSSSGSVSCSCNRGYVSVPGDETVCAEILCDADEDCNPPYGSCEKKPDGQPQVGECKCISAVSGKYCEKDGALIAIIVIIVLLIVVAVVAGVLLYMRFKDEENATKLDEETSQRGRGGSPDVFQVPGAEDSDSEHPRLSAVAHSEENIEMEATSNQ